MLDIAAVLVYALVSLVSLLCGLVGTRWYYQRTLPLDTEDLSAHYAYQEYKNAKIAAKCDQ